MNRSKGTLYLIPTPIGNLGDITLRALETLRSVPVIACEDTRTTAKLLNHYDIKGKRLISYHKFNEQQRVSEIVDILASGEDIAICSDAGSPGISDPSLIVIRESLGKDIRVEALPGATALIPALTASGLDSSSFTFLGFLPTKGKELNAKLERIRTACETVILYESPHRIYKTLEAIYQVCGDRDIVLAREISKIYEEYLRGKLGQFLTDRDITEKGEFVILIDAGEQVHAIDTDAAASLIRQRLSEGCKTQEIISELIHTQGMSKNEAYRMITEAKNNRV